MAPAVAADREAPRPVPGPFADHNYGITAIMPADAVYCPIDVNWIGSFHGYEVFLEPPVSCDPSHKIRIDTLPRLVLFYYYDTAQFHDDPDDDSDRPSDPTALLNAICNDGAGFVLLPALLLGQPAVGCEKRNGDGFEIRLISQFKATGNIDAVLTLYIVTTAERKNRDLSALRQVAESIRPCSSTAEDASVRIAPPCPPFLWPEKATE